jgi:hypothetical protein
VADHGVTARHHRERCLRTPLGRSRYPGLQTFGYTRRTLGQWKAEQETVTEMRHCLPSEEAQPALEEGIVDSSVITGSSVVAEYSAQLRRLHDRGCSGASRGGADHI